MIKAIICDWNGTLFEDRYEDLFFKGLYKAVVFRSQTVINIFKLYKLWKVKRECEKLYSNGQRIAEDQSYIIKRIVDILNTKALKDLSVSVLENYTEKYAKEAANRLDERLLRPLKKLREDNQLILGIISSGYRAGIEKTLASKGYYVDFVEANDFEEDKGKIKCFKFYIYTNKKAVLAAILGNSDIDRSEAVYIGDDWQDIDCFKEIDFPVVSFLAEDSFKESCAKELNAFVPANENDFKKYIRKNL